MSTSKHLALNGYKAYVGAAELARPDDATIFASAGPGAGWTALGDTKDGSQLELSATQEDIYVDESDYPVHSYNKDPKGELSLELAYFTLRNLKLALGNTGSVTRSSPTAPMVYEPDLLKVSTLAILLVDVDAREGYYMPLMSIESKVSLKHSYKGGNRTLPIMFTLLKAAGKPAIQYITANDDIIDGLTV